MNPLCSYCLSDNELISHLYFICPRVHRFWSEVVDWLNLYSIKFPLEVKTILFGHHREKAESKANKLILWIKNFIWANKFRNQPLTLEIFKSVLKVRLKEQKEIHEYLGKENLFDDWLPLYDSLF